MQSARAGPAPRSTRSCVHVHVRRISCLSPCAAPPRLASPCPPPPLASRSRTTSRFFRIRRSMCPRTYLPSLPTARTCRPTYLTAPNRARAPLALAHTFLDVRVRSLSLPRTRPPPVERRTCIPYVPAVSVTVLYLNHKIPSPCPLPPYRRRPSACRWSPLFLVARCRCSASASVLYVYSIAYSLFFLSCLSGLRLRTVCVCVSVCYLYLYPLRLCHHHRFRNSSLPCLLGRTMYVCNVR